MINDLPEVVHESTCLLFADDLKLVREIGDVTDSAGLQSDIDRVVEWSHENKLHFNVAKCSVLSFSRSRGPYHHSYYIEGEPLQRVTEVNDLGVRFSADLNFRDHITEVCKRAYRNLGFILRQSGTFTNISAIRALYEALVKSRMECNSVVWSPSEMKHINTIERIQKKFSRHLFLKLYGVYPGYPLMYPTLFVLGMVGYTKLEVRRAIFLAQYLFKVLRGKLDNPAVLQQLSLYAPDKCVERRRRPQLLALPHACTNLLRHAPLTRALRTLNKIHEQIDLFSCTLNEFARVALYVVETRTDI
ncbi:uncharacterized protein [Epargyreus clarus]|uniref:uncharacterized protein n=1 Tax=Epargyreus clarus TaxID=520877 RepID=UPI003C2C9672